MHIAAQFWFLSRKLQAAFHFDSASLAHRNYRIGKELIECIQYQWKLFDVVDDFVDAFATITLIHFISTATVIGIASINLLTVIVSHELRIKQFQIELNCVFFFHLQASSDKFMVLYILYINTVVLQALLFAYCGDQIIENVLNATAYSERSVATLIIFNFI